MQPRERHTRQESRRAPPRRILGLQGSSSLPRRAHHLPGPGLHDRPHRQCPSNHTDPDGSARGGERSGHQRALSRTSHSTTGTHPPRPSKGTRSTSRRPSHTSPSILRFANRAQLTSLELREPRRSPIHVTAPPSPRSSRAIRETFRLPAGNRTRLPPQPLSTPRAPISHVTRLSPLRRQRKRCGHSSRRSSQGVLRPRL